MKKRIIISVSIVMAIILITAGLSFCLVACNNNSSEYNPKSEQNNKSIDNRTPQEKFQQDYDGESCIFNGTTFKYSKYNNEVTYAHSEKISGLSISVDGTFTPNNIGFNSNNGVVTISTSLDIWKYTCSYFLMNKTAYAALNEKSGDFSMFQMMYNKSNVENTIMKNLEDALNEYKKDIFSKTGYDIFE